jgi:hypothetical protein
MFRLWFNRAAAHRFFLSRCLTLERNPAATNGWRAQLSALALPWAIAIVAISLSGCTAPIRNSTSAQKGNSNSSAGVASQLIFVSQPSSAVEGATIAPAVRVLVADAQGNAVATATNPIELSFNANPGNGVLQGTTTVAASGGASTFSNLSIDAAGSGYSITASSVGLTPATSAGFSISSPLPAEQAKQADAFVDSIGVVTHLSYNDTPYFTAWPQVLTALKTLGVRHIRDGFYDWSASSTYVARHQALASAGIKCNYVVPLDASTSPGEIEQFAPAAGDMEQLEAPNECDAAGNCGANALAGIANVLGFLPTIDSAGTDLGIPVIGPSFTQQSSYASAGNISSEITDNNLHVYFGGRNPGTAGWGDADAEANSYGSLAWWLDQANLDAPGMPVEVTETGYMAYPTTSTPFTVPESVEASYLPRTLLLDFQQGIKRTFMYELLDEVSSPGYGILRADLSPKPAFTAVENLIANLQDRGPGFTPGALSYSLEGGGASLNHLLLQKRDGSFWLLLWLEEPSFNPASTTAITVAPRQVTLTLSNPGAQQILQWDTTGNLSASNATMQGNTLTLNVSDQVTIVKIAQ